MDNVSTSNNGKGLNGIPGRKSGRLVDGEGVFCGLCDVIDDIDG